MPIPGSGKGAIHIDNGELGLCLQTEWNGQRKDLAHENRAFEFHNVSPVSRHGAQVLPFVTHCNDEGVVLESCSKEPTASAFGTIGRHRGMVHYFGVAGTKEISRGVNVDWVQ